MADLVRYAGEIEQQKRARCILRFGVRDVFVEYARACEQQRRDERHRPDRPPPAA
ncbi:MAG: hypothetical protein WDN76_05290 [Alphaproteobacteria bacterium]